jgi:hypothetical protein
VVIEEIEISCEECYVFRSVHLWQDTIIIAKREAAVVGGLVFGEDAEEAGAAAGERGVEGAVGIEGVFYRLEFGVKLEYRGFEIVVEGVRPGFNRLGDDGL